VIAGGLVAGLVLNLLDVAWGMFVMQPEFDANAKRLGLDPAVQQTTAAMMTWIVIDFIYGILFVWTYAAIRPRFGPGPRTSAVAALMLWAAVVIIMYGLTKGELFTMSIWTKMSFFTLVAWVIAATAGAAVYKEG
jgi:hypothetical protein